MLLLAGRLWSQALSGTIVGTVTDQAGAVVPNAKVALTNDATQFTRAAETNAAGQYGAYSIPTGNYTLTVEMPGFQKLVRSGVRLTAADTMTVDLELAVGNVQQTVEVKATAPLLQSQTAAVSQLVTNEQMTEMPLNGRTFTSLVLLTPGAYGGSSANLGTSSYAMRGSTNISVNGSSPQNNSYVIDGMFNKNLWLNTLIMVPMVDSIQEIRVLTSNYSAEYGAAAGAVTVVQTRSGTNQHHGSAFEFLRNDRLDANTFFNNRLGASRPPFRRNEFGGTYGGPLARNKTFVFADYQGIRIRQPRTITSTIPTLAQRAMVATGDFSALGAVVYDPNTLAAGGQARAPFAGNRVPAARLDQPALKVMALLPPPSSPAATRNFIFNPALEQRTDQFDARLDQNVGASDRLFFKYSFDDSGLTNPGVLPVAANPGVPIGPYLSADGTNSATLTALRNQSWTLNFIKVVNPGMVNETRLGAVRWNQSISALGNLFNTSDAVGLKGININNRSGGLPGLTVTGFQVLGDSSTYPENSRTASFQYEDTLTLIRGSHTLKFGGLYIRHRFNGFSAFPTRGQFTFNGQYTRQTGASGAQTALADFALGAPSDVTRNILTSDFGMRFWNLAAFADDSWRITNRLTWNFGLRYEVFAPPYDVHDQWSNFNVVTGKLLLAGRDGAGRRLRNIDTNNFAPRVGLAYMLTSDRRTVLRAGFGVSYTEGYQGGGQLYKNLPFYFSQVVTTDQNARPPLLLKDGLPASVMPDINNQEQLSSGNPTAWDFDLKSTRSMQWSLGVQREIVPDLLVDLSYVGTRTLGLVAAYNINQSYPGPGAQGPRRPLYAVNPRVTNVNYRTNFGDAVYHSLQGRVEKRTSRGLSASLSYTWSKYLSNGGNINGGGNAPPQDGRCFRCDRGPMPEDRRHIAVINHVYELPFGAGRKYASRGVAGHLVGNWNVSGIWILSTGEHFTPGLAAGASNSAGGGGERPNRIRDGNLPVGERTIDRWFDLGAFAAAPQYSFGNAGRGILEGPGNFNLDLGVHRNFRFGERFRLSFRWEMFNALNRANFAIPAAAIGNPQAGQIAGTAAARIMQMALKLNF